MMSLGFLEKRWGRGLNGHPVLRVTAPHGSVPPTATAEPLRSGSVEGPCMVRYKTMSILMRILSRIKLTRSDKLTDNFKILDGFVSWKRCIL